MKLVRIFLLAALLISEIAVCYPQTIVHGYQNCVTCHATNDGGDTLRDYGRGMSEAFMSSFAREGEAREFLGLGEIDALDFGFDYRNLEVRNVDTKTSAGFEMYKVGQLVFRHAGLSISGSYGSFGSQRKIETRQYFLGYHLGDYGHNVDIKLGYFMPSVGIGLNDHDLYIKKSQGFGRGQERFVRQVSYLNSWFELKYLEAYRDFNLQKRDDNILAVKSESAPEQYLEFKFKKIEGIDLGLHARGQAGETTLEGGSIRLGKGRTYLLGQMDQNPKTKLQASYLRTGVFLFRGFDGYFQRQTLETIKGLEEIKTVGFAWMIRPRLEYEASLSQSIEGRNFIGSAKLWL